MTSYCRYSVDNNYYTRQIPTVFNNIKVVSVTVCTNYCIDLCMTMYTCRYAYTYKDEFKTT